MIPYARQHIDEDDVQAVVEALRSDFLTTGPLVARFEEAFASATGTNHAVAVSSGTAALHAAVVAAGVGPGDEVIVPCMTFVATASVALYQGATPVICDVRDTDLLIDPELVRQAVTPQTKAIIAVDLAGHPCDYDSLREVTDRAGVTLIADACHSLGGVYRGRSVGTLADMTAFSFHPVKNITTGEGGMVTTESEELASRMRQFRHHGVNLDHKSRAEAAAWYYEVQTLGYNYRLTDIQSALGLSQLGKLKSFVERRREIARAYDGAFADLAGITPLAVAPDVGHAYHLYVVRVGGTQLTRDDLFRGLLTENIRTNVHYIPVHLHPYYRERFGTGPGVCPVGEQAFEQIISLPMFPAMTDADVEAVIAAVTKVATASA